MNLRVGKRQIRNVSRGFRVSPFSQAQDDGIDVGRARCRRGLRDVEFLVKSGAGNVGHVVRANFLPNRAEDRSVTFRWIRRGFVTLPCIAPAIVQRDQRIGVWAGDQHARGFREGQRVRIVLQQGDGFLCGDEAGLARFRRAKVVFASSPRNGSVNNPS